MKVISDKTIRENTLIYYSNMPIGIISMICSFLIMTIYLSYKRFRNNAMELVFYMTIATFFNNLTYLLKYVGDEDPNEDEFNFRCQSQAFLMVWSDVSQMFWAALMSYTVYDKVVKFDISDSTNDTTWLQRLFYLTFGYLVPFILAFFLYAYDFYGFSGTWCWIKDEDYKGIIGQWVIYGMIWLCIVMVGVFSYRIIRFLDITYVGNNRIFVSKFIYKLLSYPLILTCCWVPGTINRLIYILDNKNYSTFLKFLALLLFSSQGWAYGLIYGFNPQLRRELNETFCLGTNSSNVVQDLGFSSDNDLSNENTRRDGTTGRLIDVSCE